MKRKMFLIAMAIVVPFLLICIVQMCIRDRYTPDPFTYVENDIYEYILGDQRWNIKNGQMKKDVYKRQVGYWIEYQKGEYSLKSKTVSIKEKRQVTNSIPYGDDIAAYIDVVYQPCLLYTSST